MLEIVPEEVSVLTYDRLLASSSISVDQIAILYIQATYEAPRALHGLLAAFPFVRLRPALILFPFSLFERGPMREVKALFDALGYSLSSHWEVSYWGELAYAWDRRACDKPSWWLA